MVAGTSRGSGVAYADSWSRGKGAADARGFTKGVSRTDGGSRIENFTETTSEGFSEAFETIYDEVTSSLWGWAELLKQRAWTLASVPVGTMHIRIGNKSGLFA